MDGSVLFFGFFSVSLSLSVLLKPNSMVFMAQEFRVCGPYVLCPLPYV